MPHVNVIWGGHVPAALLAQLHTHTAAGDILWLPAPQDAALPPRLMGFPHSSTQPRLTHITGPKLGEAHVDVDVGDTKLHRAKKEQLSTSCTL